MEDSLHSYKIADICPLQRQAQPSHDPQALHLRTPRDKLCDIALLALAQTQAQITQCC